MPRPDASPRPDGPPAAHDTLGIVPFSVLIFAELIAATWAYIFAPRLQARWADYGLDLPSWLVGLLWFGHWYARTFPYILVATVVLGLLIGLGGRRPRP